MQIRTTTKIGLAVIASITLFPLTGCVSTGSGYGYTHRIDPYAGRENEAAMSAIGALIRPHSKVGPAETEDALLGLRGLGTLLDLSNR